jgi:hypothetical protein
MTCGNASSTSPRLLNLGRTLLIGAEAIMRTGTGLVVMPLQHHEGCLTLDAPFL